LPYIIKYDDQNHILEGVFSGVVDTNLLKLYSIDSEKIYKEKQCKLSISDYRDATFALSVVELYRLPQKHTDLLNSFGINVHLLKRAAIFNNASSELANFFEDVAVNRGQKFKAFSDKDSAIKWLKAQKDDNSN
jgi:hypothetical protein